MTFTEWYNSWSEEPWHEDYAWVEGAERADEYETYCKTNGIEPVWDG